MKCFLLAFSIFFRTEQIYSKYNRMPARFEFTECNVIYVQKKKKNSTENWVPADIFLDIVYARDKFSIQSIYIIQKYFVVICRLSYSSIYF